MKIILLSIMNRIDILMFSPIEEVRQAVLSEYSLDIVKSTVEGIYVKKHR